MRQLIGEPIDRARPHRGHVTTTSASLARAHRRVTGAVQDLARPRPRHANAAAGRNEWRPVGGDPRRLVGHRARRSRAPSRAIPGFNVFGVHRGHYPAEAAGARARAFAALGRDVVLHVADAGRPDGRRRLRRRRSRDARRPRGASALVVHSLPAASLGHFLSTARDALPPEAVREDVQLHGALVRLLGAGAARARPARAAAPASSG